MGGVAQQGDAAVAPARQRIAIAHRIFPEFVGRLDQGARVHIRDAEALQMWHQILEAAGPRPILLLRQRRRSVPDAADDGPIGQPLVGTRAFRNRINDELRGKATGHDHRTAGQESRPVDRAAPEHEPVPARRAFVGKKLVAHDRVDTVGADQYIAARGMPMRAATVEEIGGHAALILSERTEAAIEMNARLAEPSADRLVDDGLEPATMNGELRDFVAGIESARLAPDLLPEPVGIEKLVGPDRQGVEALEQAEFGQFLDGVGQRVDADAKFADGVRLLEYLAVDPARVQHQRRHQTTDAAPCDDHLHDFTPTNNSPTGTRPLTDAQSAVGN